MAGVIRPAGPADLAATRPRAARSAGPLGYPLPAFAGYSLLGALLHVLVWQYGLWKFGALLDRARRAQTDLLGPARLAALIWRLGWGWRHWRRARPVSR